jgi:hypothetical protein
MPDVNYLAVLLAALSSFVIGGLWYSPLLFQKPWIAASGQSKEHLSSGNPAIVFGGAFLLNLAAAFVLAMWLAERGTDVQDAASAGFAVGLGLVATSIGVIYLFERRPLALWLVNGGYAVVLFTAMGAIIGAMG